MSTPESKRPSNDSARRPKGMSEKEFRRIKELKAIEASRGSRGGGGPGRGLNDIIEALIKAGITGPAASIGAETTRAGQATGGRFSGLRIRDAFNRAANPGAQVAGQIGQAKLQGLIRPPKAVGRSGGRGSSSGGLGGGGALGGGGRFSGGSPQRNEFQRDQKAQKDRAQLEKERRDSILFEEGLRRQREMEKFNLIRSIIGGLPKTRESTTQRLVNVAGGHIPKTIKSTEQIDYTDLLRGLF